jgi:hypothetical protein
MGVFFYLKKITMKHFNQSVHWSLYYLLQAFPLPVPKEILVNGNWVQAGVFLFTWETLLLRPWVRYKTANPVFNFYISRIFNPYLLLRTNLALGKISGNDALYNDPVWRKERNYSFSSTVREISELLVWNMKGNNNNELGQRFSPYMFVGLGASLLTINRDFSKFNSHYFASSSGVINGLAADINHTPPNAIVVVPLGLGIEYYPYP